MSEWYVYIVECNDGTYYTGIAKDVNLRVEKHNEGKGAKYTRSRLPVSLLQKWTCESKSEALKKELEIKKLSRKQKEDLIQQA